LFDRRSQQLIKVRIWHRESPSGHFARFLPGLFLPAIGQTGFGAQRCDRFRGGGRSRLC
jgi:hypothetical protein